MRLSTSSHDPRAYLVFLDDRKEENNCLPSLDQCTWRDRSMNADSGNARASERSGCSRIQWFTCAAGGKGESCSQNYKSFKVSSTLCGFENGSLLTYSLNRLPLFALLLALFINSCTVNSPWPSSSHFSPASPSPLFYYKVVQTERAEKIYLKAVAAKSTEKKSFTCLSEALLKCAWSFITNWTYGLLSFMTYL